MALVTRTGAAALHTALMQVLFAQDAYGVFGYTADTVFTARELEGRWLQLLHDLGGYSPLAVHQDLRVFSLAAIQRIYSASGTLFARLDQMTYESGEETDVEA